MTRWFHSSNPLQTSNHAAGIQLAHGCVLSVPTQSSFKTPICLLYSATKIAAATVFLSFRLQTRRGGKVGITEEGLLQMFAAKDTSRHDIFAIRWIE